MTPAAAPRPDVNVNTAQGLASELGGLSLGYGAPAVPVQGGADGGIGELFASEQRVVLPKKVRTWCVSVLCMCASVHVYVTVRERALNRA